MSSTEQNRTEWPGVEWSNSGMEGSRTRRLESDWRVFGKEAIASFQPCCVWELGGFLCSNFFVVLLAL